MSGQNRSDIYPGLEVDIILKKDQRSGANFVKPAKILIFVYYNKIAIV